MSKIKYFPEINPETAYDLYVQNPEWYADWELRILHAIRQQYPD